jgi:3-deoxy-manno-octulosonate cytidylyltransferase (CMP-KDO synthetase)
MCAAVAIIPARYASVRFPGKMLAAETGRPLIQHVVERAVAASRIARTIVATDDERIRRAVEQFGGEALMTSRDHPNGACRLAEACAQLLAAGELDDDDVVVNVQGDEPEIDPAIIDLAVDTLMAHSDCEAATVASPFSAEEDPSDPNVVKVVVDGTGRALYFSRALIPFYRDGRPRDSDDEAAPFLKHIGLYVYRPAFLREYTMLPPTPLEQAERLEQLRILEHGRSIAVAIARTAHHGIDTPEQYARFVKRWTAAK